MFDVIALAEHVVGNLAIDDGGAVLVKVGLDPLAISVVDDSGELGKVEVKEVRANADDGAVFLMEFLHPGCVVSRDDLPKAPEVGEPCELSVVCVMRSFAPR